MTKLQSIFVDIIEEEVKKEEKMNIWNGSIYENLPKLQSNNIGIIGEIFIKKICKEQKIPSKINGTKTKIIGGGNGDGKIKGKNVEIKTSHQGSGRGRTFQHELGENPWRSDYMIFVDVSPIDIYITIFKNFKEEEYKMCKKCIPYFPSKSFCWRKKSGAFKFDTSIKLNEESIKNGYTIKVTSKTSIKDIGLFIDKSIT